MSWDLSGLFCCKREHEYLRGAFVTWSRERWLRMKPVDRNQGLGQGQGCILTSLTSWPCQGALLRGHGWARSRWVGFPAPVLGWPWVGPAAFTALRLKEHDTKLGIQNCLFALTIGTVPFPTPNLWQLHRHYGSSRCGKDCLSINFSSDTNQVNFGHRKWYYCEFL